MFRVFDWFGDLIFDTAGVNAFRHTLGLPPVRRLTADWWWSPQRIIGLFPPWFAAPQPDWPAQLRLTGFPMFDEQNGSPALPPDLEAFLNAGAPPLVFTPGSGMKHGRFFFQAAVDACMQLGRRGLLLTRFAEQIPDPLPATVRHLHYAPFAALLPRAAGIVHHGGIGTMAEAIAAAIPQVVMPLAYDQPDNGARIHRLGIGCVLNRGKFRGPVLARMLEELLRSSEVSRRCQEVRGWLMEDAPLESTCRLIEELLTNGGELPASTVPIPAGRV